MSYGALRKGRVSEAGQVYVVTAVCAGREPLFRDLRCARLAINEMRKLHDEAKVFSLAYVVMPDHIHWLFELGHRSSLGEVMNRFKGRASREINRCLVRTGSVWQKAYYEHALRRDEDLRKQARYVVANPVRAGLVEDIRFYPHWDAVWLDQSLSA